MYAQRVFLPPSFSEIGTCDYGGWQVQKLQVQNRPAGWRPGKKWSCNLSLKASNLTPSFSGEVRLLFYSNIQLTGWGPPVLWRAICFTQSPLIKMLISFKNTVKETSRIMSNSISEPYSQAKTTCKINHHTRLSHLVSGQIYCSSLQTGLSVPIRTLHTKARKLCSHKSILNHPQSFLLHLD